MEKGNDKIIINVKKSSKLDVRIDYIELVKDGIFKIKPEIIKTEGINLIYLEQNPGTLPMIGESIRINEKYYKVKDIIRNGEGFNLSGIKVIVNEVQPDS